jgi:hypothetical protein
MPPTVALITCAEVPDLDPDNRRLIEPLAARGTQAAPAVWDDPTVDWTSFDGAVIRSCWDYVPRLAEFIAWAGSVPGLANPADVLAWNTDKRYLEEIAAAGIPVVPTAWVEPDAAWDPPADGTWVIKPAVSLCSLDTGRYRLGDPAERRLAIDLVARLRRDGRVVMVQPYLDTIDLFGETGQIYLGGELSHTIRKGAVLAGPDSGADHRFDSDGGMDIRLREPSAAERELAERVLATVPGGPDRLLYARVDVVPAPDGSPMLMELELTEPVLYFQHAPAGAERMAAAIAARLAEPVAA